MLTAVEVQRQRRRRTLPSLKQRWQEYILQRIEGYKNSLSREELLRIGDEAVAELEATVEGQFLLTEVLMQDTVDRLIWKRLSLKPFRQWAAQQRAVRAAQQEPTHWGIDPRSPLTTLLLRIEPNDSALVIGPGAEAYVYLLTAHEMLVTFLAGDLACVERVEARIAAESLSSEFSAFVVQLGEWMPELDRQADLVVFDAGALAGLSVADRKRAVQMMQAYTAPRGVHLIVPGVRSPAPEAFLSLYSGWIRDEPRGGKRRGGPRSLGVMLAKAPSHCDTTAVEAKGHARA